MNTASPANSQTETQTLPFRLSGKPTLTELMAKYFRGLGDPTRLKILELVQDKERSVGELVSLLGLSQSKVSNHLACLSWCGFVVKRREQRTIYYRLADERVTDVIKLGRELLEANAEQVASCCVIDVKEANQE